MIVEKQTEVQQLGGFEKLESFSYKMDEKDTGEIFHLLYSQLYSDKLSAVLREYGTNACDIHLEHDQKKPFEVRLPTKLNPTLRIRDFAIGLSKKQLQNVYVSMGASSKRESNLLNGCMGIGCKAAFGYSDTFEIISRHENTKIHALAYKDDSKKGVMTILKEEPLPKNEEWGLEIIVPIHEKDFNETTKKAEEIFKNFEQPPDIYHGENKLIVKSTLTGIPVVIENQNLGEAKGWAHMGNVKYPVDLKKIGIYIPKNIKITFELSIGTVSFAPSREALEYTERTKEALKNKYQDYIEKLNVEAKKAFKNCKNSWEAHALACRVRRRFKGKPSKNKKVRAIIDLSTFGKLEFQGEQLPSYNKIERIDCLVWSEKEEKKEIAHILSLAEQKGKEKLAKQEDFIKKSLPYTYGWHRKPEGIHLSKEKTLIGTILRADAKKAIGARKYKLEPKKDKWAEGLFLKAQEENVKVIILPTNILGNTLGLGPKSSVQLIEIPTNCKASSTQISKKQVNIEFILAADPSSSTEFRELRVKGKPFDINLAIKKPHTINWWKNVTLIVREPQIDVENDKPCKTFVEKEIKPTLFYGGSTTSRIHKKTAYELGFKLQKIKPYSLVITGVIKTNSSVCKNQIEELIKQKRIEHIKVVLEKETPKNCITTEEPLVLLLNALQKKDLKVKAFKNIYAVKDYPSVWITEKRKCREKALWEKFSKEFPLLPHICLRLYNNHRDVPIEAIHDYLERPPKRIKKLVGNAASTSKNLHP